MDVGVWGDLKGPKKPGSGKVQASAMAAKTPAVNIGPWPGLDICGRQAIAAQAARAGHDDLPSAAILRGGIQRGWRVEDGRNVLSALTKQVART